MPKMHSAVDEIDTAPTAPKLDPPSTPSLAPSPSLPKSSSAPAVAADSKPARPAKPSDDPVLAELEELELKNSGRPDKAVPDQNDGRICGPGLFVLPATPAEKTRSTGRVVSARYRRCCLLCRVDVQPGFRALAQPQIDRVLALVGIASPRPSPPPAPHPAKPSVQQVATASSAPAPESAADPTPRQSSGPASAAASTATSAAATPVQPVAASGTEVATPTSVATTTPAPVVAKPEVGKPADGKKDDDAALIRRPTARRKQRDYSLFQGRGEAAGSHRSAQLSRRSAGSSASPRNGSPQRGRGSERQSGRRATGRRQRCPGNCRYPSRKAVALSPLRPRRQGSALPDDRNSRFSAPLIAD